MTVLTEEPVYVLMSGALLTTTLGVLAFFSGRGVLWVLTLLALAATVVLLVYEARTVTDREKLDATLDQMLVCIRNNDVGGLAAFGSPARKDTIDRIRAEMPQYRIRSCTISRRKPPVIQATEPPTATLEFVAFVDVDATQSSHHYEGAVFRGVTLTFRREPGGEWRVVDYVHYEAPLLGMGTGSGS